MEITAPTIAVPLRKDDNGAIRVGTTRVLLEMVIVAYQQGSTPEEIQESLDSLQLADVYAVITYYLHHREEVDAYVHWVEEEGERLHREYLAEHPEQVEFEAKMKERFARFRQK